MSVNRSKIIDAVDEILAWARGEIALPIWLPGGTKAEMTMREYEAFRLGDRPEGSGQNLADAHSTNPPPQKEKQHEP